MARLTVGLSADLSNYTDLHIFAKPHLDRKAKNLRTGNDLPIIASGLMTMQD